MVEQRNHNPRVGGSRPSAAIPMKCMDVWDKIVSHTEEIILPEELKERLARGKPLRVKLGIDPTAPDVHLGWATVLWKLRQFQELGHTAVLIVGDFTAKIGDPSGQSKTRPQLSDEQIRENMRYYQEQIFKILIPEYTEFRYNSEWLSQMRLDDLIKLASKVTVAQLLVREDFNTRYREGNPIALHEFLYPVIQGYDSVMVKADVEVGGRDQKFNFLLARELQRYYGQEPEVLVLMPLLLGTDGVRKMSQSLGNYIGINEPPDEMYGKIMSIPDELIPHYYELVLRYPKDEVNKIAGVIKSGEVNPRDLKAKLAWEVVKLYHSEDAADKAADRFDRIFSKRELPEEMPTFKLPARKMRIVDIIHEIGYSGSRSEAKRLIRQGGVKVNGKVVDDVEQEIDLQAGVVLKVGKRKFARVVYGGDTTSR